MGLWHPSSRAYIERAAVFCRDVEVVRLVLVAVVVSKYSSNQITIFIGFQRNRYNNHQIGERESQVAKDAHQQNLEISVSHIHTSNSSNSTSSSSFSVIHLLHQAIVSEMMFSVMVHSFSADSMSLPGPLVSATAQFDR